VSFVEISGSKIEYVWHGPAPEQRPTLVFLHGGFGSASAWGDYPEQLADALGYGALTYSRIGYGASDIVSHSREVDFMHREALETLPKILKAFNIRNGILYGHSDGGSIALIYAGSPLNASALIRALVLEAPHVFVEDLTLNSIAQAVENYDQGELRLRLSKYHDKVDHTFRSWSQIWLDPQFRFWNIESYLRSINIPLLLLQGAKDNFGTLDQIRKIENQCSGPVRTKIFSNCRHRPHRERPKEAVQAVVEFLADVMD
jgi:pimeloyl-ACP methyl ester carboxylesterase